MKYTTFGLVLFLLSSTILSTAAQAIPEQGYDRAMAEDVMPFITAHATRWKFAGTGGIAIQTVSIEGFGAKGDIVLVPGQGEFIGKYYEVAYDLLQRGFSTVHIIDHRGQGESQRLLPKTPKRGSVEKFDNYIRDLAAFVNRLHEQRPTRKFYLLAHSMGGAVSALYLESARQAGIHIFNAAVLASPMFEVKAPVVQKGRRLILLLDTICNLGQCDEFAIGQSHFNEYTTFDGNGGTSSEVRWNAIRDYAKANPNVTISGPTYRWVREAVTSSVRISNIAPPPATPVLLFQGGKDTTVITPPQNVYCAKSPSCTLVRYENAKHEVLRETDDIRSDALDRIDRFFSSH
jgi:lysophospholipase